MISIVSSMQSRSSADTFARDCRRRMAREAQGSTLIIFSTGEAAADLALLLLFGITELEAKIDFEEKMDF